MARFFEYESDFTPSRLSLIEEIEKLADFIELSSVRYGFSIESMVTVGFSNGAHTGGALMLLKPGLVRVLVAFGTTQVLPEISSGVDLLGKQVFIANGELDDYSPERKTVALIEQLEGLGADVTLLMHPGGHQISGEHVEFIAKALQS